MIVIQGWVVAAIAGFVVGAATAIFAMYLIAKRASK
jgi:hypothetical protein